MGEKEFFVRFWGVRGTVACPGPQYVRYGGNTSCLEVCCGDRRLILDGGTGLRPLGESLKGNGPVEADLYFTHTHIDHISGMPFFRPVYAKGNTFRLWSGHLEAPHTLHTVLVGMMKAPVFPVPLDVMAANLTYGEFRAGEDLSPGDDIAIRTAPLNHPNGATGYRIDYAAKSICYITDTEQLDSGRDPSIVSLVRGADVMIYDSTYTDDEYPRFKGWGHSTWQEGVRVCDAAGVKTLVIFHHDPGHDDDFMDRVAAEANAMRPGTVVAREGLVLRP